MRAVQLAAGLAAASAPLVAAAPEHYPVLQSRANESLAYSPPHYPSPWMNPTAVGWEAAYAKARELVSQMTLLEKVNLTTGTGWQSDQCVGNTGSVPRLGIKSLCLQDSPLGTRFADYASAFSSGQTIAASWDRGLIYQRAHGIGAEQKAKGISVMLGPVAGPIGRAPTGGRNWEGFSPDPYLTGVAAAESIKGIQDAGVIATLKHYIANEQEHFRQAGEARGYNYTIDESSSSNIDDKTMHELYLWPFADGVRAGVGSIMCSYQQINNSYGCQNSATLNGLLKGELGFQGFTVSDWAAQHAGVSSALAGLDMTMPGDSAFNTGVSFWGGNLTLAVLNGTVPEYRIDDMAMRIVSALFLVGIGADVQEANFDSWTKSTYGPKHYYAKDGQQQINYHVDVQGNHGDEIRNAAAKSTVILKNNGILPLNKPRFLAVIGQDAGPNPRGPNGCPDRGCNDGTLAMSWGSGTAEFPYLVTPAEALQYQALQDKSRIESIFDNYAWSQIRTLVSQQYAHSLVFVNANSGEGYINVDGNEGDRKNLTLWGSGDDLIKNVSSVCNQTIVVIHSVGPVLLTDWYDNPNVSAIVWAGEPGQESGRSIVDVLYGRAQPGRTPFTWAAKREDYGADVLYEPNNGEGAPQQDFTEGVLIDYRYLDAKNIEPIYEFGHGLSWTTFEYSNLVVEKVSDAAYTPTTGQTAAAPTFGEKPSPDLSQYTFPNSTIRYIYNFVYPYLNTSSSGQAASGASDYGQTADEFLPPHALDSTPQPLHAAGPALNQQPGGNAQLWDVLYRVSATITNTGKVEGDEIPQLYVSLGGPGEPVRVLRGFDRLSVAPGQSVQFCAELTRRDVSNWDVVSQNWVITEHAKTVYVGSSSRKLPLSAPLK
ncbi:glycosyl hydrolase family 3 N terminal domain-containing protein [Microdochium trichocladiopsis]|uniref:beta-glucosidase n=1 Tax=Microdochium trichocladiopsis TaxID=1682393 RepID=A0A9P8YFM7_9PEZI|nr:glycosyl hydrolase family 3 N terminal domain-containing protein [Microdochium trichocladiopsis]KAH7038027.1 glycosyl hydrolase family 3 N terminal domain-containing protein [Microdochium trichocladiopsis]